MEAQSVSSLRALLYEHGLRPVPVLGIDAQGSPSPGKAPLGKDWTNEARKDPPFCASHAAVSHALNTGILCDGLRAVDLDIEDSEIVKSVCSLAESIFGAAPRRFRRNSPRCLLLYQAAEGEPPKRTLSGALGKIEILGRGQQFVADGRHPSGAEIEWFPEPIGEVTRGDLRAVSEDQIGQFLAAAAPLIEADPPARVNGHDPHAGNGYATADALDIAAALACIPNVGAADWEAWNRIGMAVWAASGGSAEGYAAWVAWSSKNPAHDVENCQERWQHYPSSPPSSIGAGTLFHLAKEAWPDWRKPSAAPTIPPPPCEDDYGREPNGTALESLPTGPSSIATSDLTWPSPLDFFSDDSLTGTPELRPEHLPAAISPFVLDTAARLGADPAAVALSCLVALASVMSDEWRVQPKRFDTEWTEQPRIWGAIVGDPSLRKTPVIKAATAPIDAMEVAVRIQHAADSEQYRIAYAKWKKAKGAPEDEPRAPILDRYIVESTTIEALSEVLRDDARSRQRAPQHKVLVRQDELSELLANFDRYKAGGSGAGDRGAFLRLYNGGRYVVDRVLRGSFACASWSACLLGGIQPGPIQRIAAEAVDDGLLQRFCYCLTVHAAPEQDRCPDVAAIERYRALFPSLATLHPPRRPGSSAAQIVVFHHAAQTHRQRVSTAAELCAAVPDASARLKSALGKWPGLFPRMALVFHLIGLADEGGRGEEREWMVISEATAERAASYLVDILLPHLLRTDALLFASVRSGHAQWIAGYILARNTEILALRDLVQHYRPLRGQEHHAELLSVLEGMETFGWLRRRVPRRASPHPTQWDVNPDVHRVFAARAAAEREQRAKNRAELDARVSRDKNNLG